MTALLLLLALTVGGVCGYTIRGIDRTEPLRQVGEPPSNVVPIFGDSDGLYVS